MAKGVKATTQEIEVRRFHLFEFEDQRWFPAVLRDGITSYLKFAVSTFGLCRPAQPLIEDALAHSESDTIIDLGSGGGGPILSIHDALIEANRPTRIILTDKFPNLVAFEHLKKVTGGKIEYDAESIDATEVPSRLSGLRTMFLSFHHFRPPECEKILGNAVESNSSIAIFELYERKWSQLLPLILVPLFVLLMMPFVRPFRLSRLVFTYLIPVLPLLIWWDGIVSVLRSYTVPELQEIAASVEAPNYEWKADTIKGQGPNRLTYLIGTPHNSISS